MAIKDAKQFDGTRGSAKVICGWLGEGKAHFGSTFNFDRDWIDTDEAGMDLIEERDGAPFYVTVQPTDWIAMDDQGAVHVFTDAQLRAVFTPG